MYPKFDAASVSVYEAALSTYSFTHTIGRGLANRVLLVAIHVFAAGSVSGITYNGVALTLVRSDASGIYKTEWWRLSSPTEGANTVAVTLSASLTSIAAAISVFDADVDAPINAQHAATGTGSSASDSIIPTKRLCLVVGALTTAAASGATSDAAQTSRTVNSGALGTGAVDSKGPIDPAASTSLTWTGLGAADTFVVSLLAINPSPTPSVNADGYRVRPRPFGPGIAR